MLAVGKLAAKTQCWGVGLLIGSVGLNKCLSVPPY